MSSEQLLVTLLSVIGSGTLVPLVYGIWKRRRESKDPVEIKRADAKEDERASKAAREAVDAVRDVLTEMRTQREEDRKEIAGLKETVRGLSAEVEHLKLENAAQARKIIGLERGL